MSADPGAKVSLGFGPGPGLLQPTPPGRIGPGAHRNAIGHAVQPGAQPMHIAQSPGLADQDQEGRLERIVNVVGIGEPAAADSQDHRAVPLDECLQRRYVAVGNEPIQELTVVQTGHAPGLE